MRSSAALAGLTATGEHWRVLAARAPDHEAVMQAIGKANKGGRTRKLVVLYPKGCLANLRPIASIFREKSGIELVLKEAMLDEISSQMILEHRLASKDGYFDVAIPPTFSIPDLVQADVVSDLSAFAAQYEPAGFRNTCYYSVGDKFNGKLYGYQTDGDAYLLFLNKQFLENGDARKAYSDRFGRKLSVPKEWSELDRQMKFFHDPKRGSYGGSLFRNKGYMTWEFWARLHAKGLYPFDADMNPRIASDEAIDALHELTRASRYLSTDVKTNGLFDNFKSFSLGDKYCNLGWGGTQKFLNGPDSQIRGRLAYAPLPGGRVRGQVFQVPYFNWGWNFVVSTRSKVPELSYLFCLYAGTPKISTLAIREKDGYFDPYCEGHYQDATIRKIYGDDFLKTHRESLRGSIPDLYLPGYNRYFSTLSQAIYAAERGEVSVKLALKTLEKKWRQLTTSGGKGAAIKQWRFIRDLYPRPLKKVLK